MGKRMAPEPKILQISPYHEKEKKKKKKSVKILTFLVCTQKRADDKI